MENCKSKDCRHVPKPPALHPPLASPACCLYFTDDARQRQCTNPVPGWREINKSGVYVSGKGSNSDKLSKLSLQHVNAPTKDQLQAVVQRLKRAFGIKIENLQPLQRPDEDHCHTRRKAPR